MNRQLKKLQKEQDEIKSKQKSGKKLTDWERAKLKFNAVLG